MCPPPYFDLSGLFQSSSLTITPQLPGNSSKKSTSGAGKLVDVVALRARFSVKLATSVKFAGTALSEAVQKYRNFVDKEEVDFYERFQSHLAQTFSSCSCAA